MHIISTLTICPGIVRAWLRKLHVVSMLTICSAATPNYGRGCLQNAQRRPAVLVIGLDEKLKGRAERLALLRGQRSDETTMRPLEGCLHFSQHLLALFRKEAAS